ncbi:MAG: hypothetical protein ACOYOJ_21550 [Alsobacter sp.]
MTRPLILAAACGLLAVASPGLAFGETEQNSYAAGGSDQNSRDRESRYHDGREQNVETGHGRGWRGDRDGQWRDSGRGYGRGDDRRERRGAGAAAHMDGEGDKDMAGTGAPHGDWMTGQGSRFMLTTGTTRLAVMCGARETLRDCVEAATLLLDRATRVPASAAGAGGAAPPAATAPKAP